MAYYKAVTKGLKVIEAHEIKKEIYDVATDKESIEFFADMGGKEEFTKYGLRSSREGREEVYHFIKQLSATPNYIWAGVREIIEGAK